MQTVTPIFLKAFKAIFTIFRTKQQSVGIDACIESEYVQTSEHEIKTWKNKQNNSTGFASFLQHKH